MSSYWIHNLDPFLLRFPQGWPLEGVRWYGVAYLMGFIAGWLLLALYYKKGRSPLGPEAQAGLMTYLIAGVLVGGRLGYVLLYAFPQWVHDPLLVFRVWQGGMASHGGFAGVLIALWLFARAHRMRFLALGDIVVTLVPPGLFFGRIANFINGELWGKISSVSWAVIFPKSAPSLPAEMVAPRHPSQLYEAALEGVLLFALTQWLFWRKPAEAPKHSGRLSGIFLLAYALVRILCEVFREPDAGLIFGMSRGTFYSIFLVALGALLLWVSRRPDAPTPDAGAKRPKAP